MEKEYKILSTISCDMLTASVKEHMNCGWIPQGGVCYANSTYYQAMIK